MSNREASAEPTLTPNQPSVRRVGVTILFAAILAVSIGRLGAPLLGERVAEFMALVALFSTIVWGVSSSRGASSLFHAFQTVGLAILLALIWLLVDLGLSWVVS